MNGKQFFFYILYDYRRGIAIEYYLQQKITTTKYFELYRKAKKCMNMQNLLT
jgi:hypothetical protein